MSLLFDIGIPNFEKSMHMQFTSLNIQKKFRYMLFENPEERIKHEDKKTRSNIYVGTKTIMLAIL